MGELVWVIGASKGLGRALAAEFARRGRRVVGVARSAPHDVAGFHRFERCDVADEPALEALVVRLLREEAPPRLVVYCAAQVYQGALLEQSEAALRAELETNYLAFVRLTQAIALHKPPAAPVRLVATASTLGYVGCPSLDNYSAAKAAVISFVRSARLELAACNIELAALSPPHMDNGADLRGPQPFTVAWAAPRFADAAERGLPEHVLGASNRLMVRMGRYAPRLAQRIMNAIGVDALSRLRPSGGPAPPPPAQAR